MNTLLTSNNTLVTDKMKRTLRSNFPIGKGNYMNVFHEEPTADMLHVTAGQKPGAVITFSDEATDFDATRLMLFNANRLYNLNKTDFVNMLKKHNWSFDKGVAYIQMIAQTPVMLRHELESFYEAIKGSQNPIGYTFVKSVYRSNENMSQDAFEALAQILPVEIVREVASFTQTRATFFDDKVTGWSGSWEAVSTNVSTFKESPPVFWTKNHVPKTSYPGSRENAWPRVHKMSVSEGDIHKYHAIGLDCLGLEPESHSVKLMQRNAWLSRTHLTLNSGMWLIKDATYSPVAHSARLRVHTRQVRDAVLKAASDPHIIHAHPFSFKAPDSRSEQIMLKCWIATMFYGDVLRGVDLIAKIGVPENASYMNTLLEATDNIPGWLMSDLDGDKRVYVGKSDYLLNEHPNSINVFVLSEENPTDSAIMKVVALCKARGIRIIRGIDAYLDALHTETISGIVMLENDDEARSLAQGVNLSQSLIRYDFIRERVRLPDSVPAIIVTSQTTFLAEMVVYDQVTNGHTLHQLLVSLTLAPLGDMALTFHHLNIASEQHYWIQGTIPQSLIGKTEIWMSTYGKASAVPMSIAGTYLSSLLRDGHEYINDIRKCNPSMNMLDVRMSALVSRYVYDDSALVEASSSINSYCDRTSNAGSHPDTWQRSIDVRIAGMGNSQHDEYWGDPATGPTELISSWKTSLLRRGAWGESVPVKGWVVQNFGLTDQGTSPPQLVPPTQMLYNLKIRDKSVIELKKAIDKVLQDRREIVYINYSPYVNMEMVEGKKMLEYDFVYVKVGMVKGVEIYKARTPTRKMKHGFIVDDSSFFNGYSSVCTTFHSMYTRLRDYNIQLKTDINHSSGHMAAATQMFPAHIMHYLQELQSQTFRVTEGKGVSSVYNLPTVEPSGERVVYHSVEEYNFTIDLLRNQISTEPERPVADAVITLFSEFVTTL
uniref:Uncharacterized protein n=1 Tax=viral metagenome TaxID=1070528 RepID=A0A2V0R9M9_9ZZZZ